MSRRERRAQNSASIIHRSRDRNRAVAETVLKKQDHAAAIREVTASVARNAPAQAVALTVLSETMERLYPAMEARLRSADNEGVRADIVLDTMRDECARYRAAHDAGDVVAGVAALAGVINAAMVFDTLVSLAESACDCDECKRHRARVAAGS